MMNKINTFSMVRKTIVASTSYMGILKRKKLDVQVAKGLNDTACLQLLRPNGNIVLSIGNIDINNVDDKLDDLESLLEGGICL